MPANVPGASPWIASSPGDHATLPVAIAHSHVPMRPASSASRRLSALARSWASATFSLVTSRVEHRVWTNRPSSNRALESISTCLIEPSRHFSRAGNARSVFPLERHVRIESITGWSAWNSATCRPT